MQYGGPINDRIFFFMCLSSQFYESDVCMVNLDTQYRKQTTETQKSSTLTSWRVEGEKQAQQNQIHWELALAEHKTELVKSNVQV